MDVETAFQALDAYIGRKMDLGSIPGLAIGVTSRERILGCRYYGFSDVESRLPPTEETLFEIGSISKSFASIVAMQLVDEGLLDLSRPVDEYLPWLEAKWKGERFTMHHLMSHTAGLPIGSEATPEATSEVWAVRDLELGCPPGQFFHYSSIGYKIVGLVIEELTRKRCADAIKERVFAQLGMVQSRAVISADLGASLATPYEPFPDDRPVRRGTVMVRAPWLESDSADGSISSNAQEMAAYLRMLLSGGRSPGGRVLSEDGFRRLTRPVISYRDGSRDEHYAYGLSVERSGSYTLVGHTGGMVGYVSAMKMDMDAGFGAIVLTNGATDVDDVARFALKAFGAVSSGSGEIPRDLPYNLSVDDAEGYAGIYSSEAGCLEVVADARQRLVLATQGRSTMLEPREKGAFFVDLPGFETFLLRFSRVNGLVTEVSCGADVYFHERRGEGAPPVQPSGHEAYCGHFRSSNPWLTNFRVLARKDALWMVQPSGEEQELVELGQGSFRVGSDERCPERLRFFALVNGKANRVDVSGQVYARTSTP